MPRSPEGEDRSLSSVRELPPSPLVHQRTRGILSPSTEELLLLGLILLLLREGGECAERGDLDETVILLGLILLFG